MALLNVYNLKMEFGERLLFSGASFEIGDYDKVGVIGANGTGKTTLFKLITGEMQPSAGEIYKSKNAVVGYMEQHACSDSSRSLYSEVLTVFEPLMKMEDELEEIAFKIETQGADDAILERQAHLTERFERDGGLTFRSRAKAAIIGLGFSEKDMDLPCGKLSGGQRSKISLAKLLLSGANFLLLDEPTNHLDIKSVEWLEDFLKNFSGGCLIISHDRYFLDKVTDKTMMIENKRVNFGNRSYSGFIQLREEQREIELRHYENTMKEAHRIEGIIEQQRRWNRERNIRMAESKQKQLDRLLENVEKPESEAKTLVFKFSASQVSGNEVLNADNLSKSFGDKKIFSDISFQILRNEKVFLLGENGCGKTTLFKMILGTYPCDNGTVKLGANVKIGYFDQTLESLNNNATVLSEIWDCYPAMIETAVRSALAAFLFMGDDISKRISSLSGGEKARVALLKLMLSGANFLLLDEPTNHLDISSREALENAIARYDGTVFAISHDRYFINKLADRILWMNKSGIEKYQGDYDYFAEKRAAKEAEVNETKEQNKKPKVNLYVLRKEAESEKRKLNTAIKKCENEIEETEAKIEKLNSDLADPEISSNYEDVMELTEKLDEATKNLDRLYGLWDELHEKLDKITMEINTEY